MAKKDKPAACFKIAAPFLSLAVPYGYLDITIAELQLLCALLSSN